MNILHKIIIIFIIFFASILIFNLLKERKYLINLPSKDKEGFALFPTINSEKDKIENKLNSITIQNSIEDDSLPLKDYVYKASYNSAVSGDFVSNDMISLVLSRGCRFIDFEILIIDNEPVISYTKDSEYLTKETNNHITLSSALTTVSTTAFSNAVPNPNDPLFIHLRVKSNDENAFQHIASSIHSTIANTNKLYVPKNMNSKSQVVRHERENKMRLALRNAQFKVSSEMIDFLIHLPNYFNYHQNVTYKNKLADEIIKNISENPPNYKKIIESRLQLYKNKMNMLRSYSDLHFSGITGKYIYNDKISSTEPGVLIPKSDIKEFLSYGYYSESFIRKEIIPMLSKTNQIDDLSTIKLKDVKGKMLILIDNTNFSNFNKLISCNSKNKNCLDIHDYIFSKSNTDYFQKNKFADIIDSPRSCSANKLTIGVPDTFSGSNINNPDIRTLIYNNRLQIPCYKFYNVDSSLILQEKMFNQYKSAIVPIKTVIADLRKCNDDIGIESCFEFTKI
jgi:hypothetical protein